jgi:predicted acyl esterase
MRRVVLAISLLLAVVAPVAPVATHAADPTPYPGGVWEPPAASFGVVAVRNVPVTMDDGASLTADVYYPADLGTGTRAPGTFPVLLTQTPYTSSTAALASTSSSRPGEYFVTRGYIFVSVDVRGTGRSGGNGGFFSPRDAQDGVNLVDWVAHSLDGSNGVVGLTGCSYLGQTQMFTAAKLGPGSPVKAMIPACTSGDNYRDTYLDNGIPTPAWMGAGLAAGTLLGPTIEAYMVPQYLNSIVDDANGQAGDNAYDKEFWLDRDHVYQAADVVASGIPALLWVGWDEPGFGDLELYAALQNAYFGRSPFAPLMPGNTVTGRYQVITGDWGHGGGLDEGIMLQWYDTWLKGVDTGMPLETSTPLHIQERGSGRWVNASSYPLTATSTELFFDHTALGSAPPASPATETVLWGPPQVPGTTLTFTSAPFATGATLAGAMSVAVTASSSTNELQLMADLYDVAPDGTATQVTHGGFLGSLGALDAGRSWTDTSGHMVRPFLSLLRDDYLTPGESQTFEVPLAPAVFSVEPGHSLRLQLATMADELVCQQKTAQIVASPVGCRPRPSWPSSPGVRTRSRAVRSRCRCSRTTRWPK